MTFLRRCLASCVLYLLMDQVQAFPAWRQSALADSAGVVLVTSHRACWKETSENSLDGIARCIADGIDIGEIDVRTTRDGALVLMHDERVDRTTDGQGAVADLSLDQIRRLRLRQRGGGADTAMTARRVPTLQEALALARGRILLNLDVKAAQIPALVAAIMETDTARDVLLNVDTDADSRLLAWVRSLGIAMQVLYFDNRAGADRAAQWQALPRLQPTSLQLVFRDPDVIGQARQAVQSEPVRIFVNTMALDIASGHPMDLSGPYLDSVAITHPEQVWRPLIERGASIIQTDEPQRLLRWLRQQGWR